MTKKYNTLSKLKQQEREARENLIIEAACRVFSTKTYDQVSMHEIAREAGMSKSSIYTYFPNQEALFVETALRDTERLVGLLEKQFGSQSEFSLDRLIEFYLDYYIRHQTQWRMITHFALHGDISEDSAEKLNMVGRRLMNLLEMVLKEMGFQGDTRLLAHTLFSILSGILISYRNYPCRSEAERIAHIKRIGKIAQNMMLVYIDSNGATDKLKIRP